MVHVIAIVSEGDETIKNLADHVIEVPDCHESIAPLLTCSSITNYVVLHCFNARCVMLTSHVI